MTGNGSTGPFFHVAQWNFAVGKTEDGFVEPWHGLGERAALRVCPSMTPVRTPTAPKITRVPIGILRPPEPILTKIFPVKVAGLTGLFFHGVT